MVIPKEISRADFDRMKAEPHCAGARLYIDGISHVEYAYIIKPTYRPWRADEVPVGAVVKYKIDTVRRLIVAAKHDCTVSLGGHHYDIRTTLIDLFENWTLADGTPCGTKE